MKLLLYCCKNPHKLYATDKGYIITDFELGDYYKTKEKLNGKIVAECDFEVEEIQNKLTNNNSHLELFTDSLTEKELFEKSCLNRYEMFSYLKNDFTKKDEIKGYAIHIKGLHIFDKPRELYDCLIHPKIEHRYYGCEHLNKAPQNMMYVELDDIKCILISIRPEWLCKILNGEKTIEVRKKVLKEILK